MKVKDGIKKLSALYAVRDGEMVNKARKYVEGRNWEISVEQMERAAIAARRESSG